MYHHDYIYVNMLFILIFILQNSIYLYIDYCISNFIKNDCPFLGFLGIISKTL